MEERDRFISSTKNMSDVEVENKLRPVSFDEYVGQEKIKSNLKVLYIVSSSNNSISLKFSCIKSFNLQLKILHKIKKYILYSFRND